MKPALLLIDLQADFLASPGLQPAAGALLARATELLSECRQRGLPVIHVLSSVHRQPDDRMPHWRRDGRWLCVQGSAGHAEPEALRPLPGEAVVHKRFFSAFEDGRLATELARLGCDSLWIAGMHLHGCVRASALDAYQHGLSVIIADDAVASDDPVHAAITRRYLDARSIRFVPVAGLLAGPIKDEDSNAVADAVQAAQQAYDVWRSEPMPQRITRMESLAVLLHTQTETLAREVAVEIGKPLGYARAEIERSVELLRSAARWAREPGLGPCGRLSEYRDRPLGVVAAITPWNNPVALPLGKLAPALLFGNAVVWKPAPAAAAISEHLATLIGSVGFPPDLVRLLPGDAATARALMSSPLVEAVSLTGSEATGRAAQEICARRHIPLQTELGGNNAAIVWPDCNLRDAAHRIAEAAFGFAGQRCTACRRVVLADACRDVFLRDLREAADSLVWGDPLHEQTQMGPLVSVGAAQRIAALLVRSGAELLFGPRLQAPSGEAYHPPAVLACDDTTAEIVQEESFGPVLVVQAAHDFEHALELCNGVRQGLVASLFSDSSATRAHFIDQAQAGILKLGLATADADTEAPFIGWKASGAGPAEHGRWDRLFYTRPQALYRRQD